MESKQPKISEDQALTIVANVTDGDYVSGLAQHNWLADVNLNIATVARLLEVAYLTGRQSALEEVAASASQQAKRSNDDIRWQIATAVDRTNRFKSKRVIKP